MRLRNRQLFGLAIDGSPRGGKNHLADSVGHRVLQHVEHAQNVDVGVCNRVLNGSAHIYLRRMMADHGRTLLTKNALEPPAPDVGFVEARGSIYVLALARRQIIDDDHLVTFLYQPVDNV